MMNEIYPDGPITSGDKQLIDMVNEMPRDNDGYSPLYYQSLLIQTIRNEVEEIQVMEPEVTSKVRRQLMMLLTAANKAEKALIEMKQQHFNIEA